MKAQPQAMMFQKAHAAKVELVLSCNDGSPWTLRMSAGCQRFVGHYPRLPRMVVDGPVLRFRAPYPGS
ncbi:MAG TPA: hypothetical protein VF619_02190 [Allosphingosinicella sp.]|jgi:hypothetical protein